MAVEPQRPPISSSTAIATLRPPRPPCSAGTSRPEIRRRERCHGLGREGAVMVHAGRMGRDLLVREGSRPGRQGSFFGRQSVH